MAEFTISRHQHVAATPEAVHALVNDFHEWVAWSPWEDLDPAMTHTYTGPASGVGAVHSWKGNKKAGEGSMSIVGSTPEAIDIDLAFLKPFPARNRVSIAFALAADGTDVTWTMTGTQGLVGRVFFKLMKMEDALGRDFERGLVKLKAAAEAR